MDCVACGLRVGKTPRKRDPHRHRKPTGAGYDRPAKARTPGTEGAARGRPREGGTGKRKEARRDPAKGKTREERENASEAERAKRAAPKKQTAKPETPRGRI